MLPLVLLASLAATDYAVVGALLAGGEQQLQQGKIDDAIRSFRTATELAPKSGRAWFQLSWAYRRNGQMTDASVARAMARQLSPQGIIIERTIRVPIHMDCWGNGGPCPPGTLPNLGGVTISSPNVENLAQIIASPHGVDVRPKPAQQQR